MPPAEFHLAQPVIPIHHFTQGRLGVGCYLLLYPWLPGRWDSGEGQEGGRAAGENSELGLKGSPRPGPSRPERNPWRKKTYYDSLEYLVKMVV